MIEKSGLNDINEKYWVNWFEKPRVNVGTKSVVQGICMDDHIVFGFVKGHFTASEMQIVLNDLAKCAGIAPNVADYFQSHQDLDVHTGGLTINNPTVLPVAIQKIVLEFIDGKIVNEHVFLNLKKVWFDSMRTLRALHLPGEVSQPLR